MKNFKTLKAWELGKEIAVEVYRLTSQLSSQQQYVFANQIARSALSIPSNVAEGNSRKSEKDYARFIEIALGSAFELETQLIVLADLSIASSETLSELISKVEEEQRILYGLLRKLRNE